MATVPVKSHQPLHNFSLPFLKWGQRNHINTNHRCLRHSDCTRNSSPPPLRRSPPPDSDSDFEDQQKPSARSRNRLSICSQKEKDAVGVERESYEGDVEVEVERENQKVCDEADGEESVAKPWNLRPRRAVVKAVMETVIPAVPAVPKSGRLRGLAEGEGGSERKEKRKFWISLSREEIEEDLYALTGSKPARRPKKRSKTVQKQLDNLFPGLYMVGITADSYGVYNALK